RRRTAPSRSSRTCPRPRPRRTRTRTAWRSSEDPPTGEVTHGTDPRLHAEKGRPRGIAARLPGPARRAPLLRLRPPSRGPPAGGVGHADVPEVRARRPLVRRLGREAPALLACDVRRPDVPQGPPREGLMPKCPWPPCGQELGAVAGDKSIVVDHPGHRA